ncbi:tRNA ligase [Sugiyamaella lignohabitans]|uniref:tRNA ligase n=1 Tax=Sugiyamaella lignohabitans TaxID=796027 RepID=A0A167F4M2_9ASCO|nr:tRNA ligase [Sugiyamaella lignohabitans]ANB14818.1 tRNA ligase [Sugiyamaella lignohabitans]
MIEKLATNGADPSLIAELEWAATQDSKAGKARKSEHQIWDRPDIRLTGWKFNEWDYGKEKIQLPINARGLFSLGDKVVVRGYDKFFNIDEVATTSWKWIENNTQGPYYLTLKENGCIVFLSGLEDGTLIVTSKHSTGPREDSPNETNHSWVARKWVDSHLSRVGKTRQELANELYELDATAVGELCDDSFEEHILPYTNDKAGIYLHGLNANTRKFITYPFQVVDELSEKYGFIKTKYLVKNDVTTLKEFLHECSETGSWENDDIEGFVVRCKKNTGDDFFFKYKFEEPYLMYRDWREVTKAYIKSPDTAVASIKRNKPLTLEYLKFIKPILDNDPVAAANFLKNHGIIALREKFLQSKGQSGMELAKLQEDAAANSTNGIPAADIKYALIPAATIGCGKTTLALALTHLTGWGLVQNDNYFMKGAKVRLVTDACEGFKTHNVMFIDRNNHMVRERRQIMEDLLAKSLDEIRFICLNFLPNGASESIFRFTRDRVSNRGDNHQTITGLSSQKVDGIMRGFVNRFQRVNPSQAPDNWFHEIINLDVPSGTKENLKRVLHVLKEKYALVGDFSEQQIDEALSFALEYKAEKEPVKVKGKNPKQEKTKNTGDAKKKEEKPVEPVSPAEPAPPLPLQRMYYSLLLDANKEFMIQLIDSFFAANPQVNDSYWKHLKESMRVQNSFHVTLVHRDAQDNAEKKDCFAKLDEITDKSSIPIPAEGDPVHLRIPDVSSPIRILSLCHDDAAMALKVEVASPEIPFANGTAHITIGTSLGIPAFRSLEMLAAPTSQSHPWNVQPAELSSYLDLFLGHEKPTSTT